MATYVVTGASRGLGYEFIRQYSKIPGATVFGLVRNAAPTEQKVKEDGLDNIHIIQADITNRKALEEAAARISEIVPSVDYLINNAAFLSATAAFNSLTDFSDRPDVLEYELTQNFQTNVVGVIKTINAFLPLILKSKIKKIITISSGIADDNLSNVYDVFEGAPYAISKAGVNTAMVKYNAKHGKKDQILFLSISPGVVDTNTEAAPPADSELPMKFMKAYPKWTGPITPEQSVKMMTEVFDRAAWNNEFAGAFVSQYGTKEWL